MANRVELQLGLNASQMKSEAKDLSGQLTELINKAKELSGVGDYNGAAAVYSSINNIQQSMAGMNKQAGGGQGGGGGNGGSFGQGIMNAASGSENIAGQFARGDASGVAVSATKNAGRTMRDFGGSLAKTEGLGGLGKILGFAGVSAAVLGAIGGAANALSGAYEERLPNIDEYQRLYNKDITVNQRKGEDYETARLRKEKENSKASLEWYKKAADIAKGTGMSTEDFLESSKVYGAYGEANGTRAMQLAAKDAKLAQVMNGDLSAIQNITGTSRRYGMGDNAAQQVAGTLTQTGMQKGQFNELLQGIQKVMEDGISKGFKRSASDIGANLSFFTKLTNNNPLWQGEQGLQKMQTIEQGLSSATALQSTTDVIAYMAADKVAGTDRGQKFLQANGGLTGTYIDTERILEGGFSGDILPEIFDITRSLHGTDIAGIIEQLKANSGLNYSGATELYNIMLEYEKKKADGSLSDIDMDQLQKKIESVKVNTDYQSDSTKQFNTLNDLNKTVVEIGKKAEGLKFGVIEHIDKGVTAIWSILDAKGASEAQIEAVSELFDENEGRTLNGTDYKTETGKQLRYLKDKGDARADKFISFVNTLSADEKRELNTSDVFNLPAITKGSWTSGGMFDFEKGFEIQKFYEENGLEETIKKYGNKTSVDFRERLSKSDVGYEPADEMVKNYIDTNFKGNISDFQVAAKNYNPKWLDDYAASSDRMKRDSEGGLASPDQSIEFLQEIQNVLEAILENSKQTPQQIEVYEK